MSENQLPGTSNEKRTVCVVCKHGALSQGKGFFFKNDPFEKCDECNTEFHKVQGKTILKKVPQQFGQWKNYEGQLLTGEEIQRISNGGLSDAQIAEQKIARQEELAEQERVRQKRLAEEEEARRIRSTPGTYQFFIAEFKRIVGISDSDESLQIKITWQTKADARLQIKRIAQTQRELRQLKKDINLRIKDIHSLYKEQKASVEAENWTWMTGFRSASEKAHLRAQKRQALAHEEAASIEPYARVIRIIEDSIAQFDKLKVGIDKQITETAATTKSKISEPRETELEQKNTGSRAQKRDIQQLLKELNGYVGLEPVKHEINELVNFLKIQNIRKGKGLPTPDISLHVVFYGNPGTGKTSMARVLAQIYQSLGFLSSGQLVETDRSSLVAGYVGQTAIKVAEAVRAAIGGVLFIDEAYSLVSAQGQDYGSEAIETLLKQMEDHRDNLAVIVAGYPEKMQSFINSNPGLRSRFSRYWKFEDYNPDELLAIFDSFCQQGAFQLSMQAREKTKDILCSLYEKRDSSFGNARMVRNIFESAISNQASRLVDTANPTTEALSTIEVQDIEAITADEPV